MRKIYVKLATSLVAVLMSFTLVIGVSFAWMTLSTNPVVSGVQVAIGGGTTILLAPDITETVKDAYGNTVTVHYPGAFDSTLQLSQHASYDYLSDLAGLTPVSTADGIHWILPAYSEETGTLLDISEFEVDSTLSRANAVERGKGTYVYMDFWVVSPGAAYDLHVSTDTKTNQGSFLMELPQPVEGENGTLTLGDTAGQVASTARVGFLVNQQTGSNAAMTAYSASADYDSRFKSLSGVYQEPGNYEYDGEFTVYEPNATLHPSEQVEEGAYVVTRPLSYDETTGQIAETEFRRVMAQRSSSWQLYDGGLWLSELFTASMAGQASMTAEQAGAHFYHDYLGGQVAPYVTCGNFFSSTTVLHDLAAASGGTVAAETLTQAAIPAGATGDVTIGQVRRNVPQRIRMFIWLEGQDVDCINSSAVEAATFALGIELSGETIS